MSKKERPYISPEDNKKANILSGISLACLFAPIILRGIARIDLIADFIQMLKKTILWFSGFCSFLNAVLGCGFLAAIILVIIVRVKYPGNRFGKVLMWIYIALILLTVVVFVLLIVLLGLACNWMGTNCSSLCEGCRTMGVFRWF